MEHQQKKCAEEALNVARSCVTTRFKGATFAFAAGSIMRGEGADFSDIDLFVVFPIVQRAWRESFEAGGFPVETFVHDPETLAYYLHKDIESGCPVMVSMVATGTVIGEDPEAAEAVQAEARRMLAKGPAPLSGPTYDWLRYVVSDLADDLRGKPPAQEIVAIAAGVYPQLIDLMLLGRGAWTGRGKWGPRLLARFDSKLADALTLAFVQATQGDGSALLALVESELRRHGGRHFAGYRQEAPLEARRISNLRT